MSLVTAEDGEVILVVEDEPGVLELAVETLHELGYATLTAPNAAVAMQHLKREDRVDVLFSDMVTPQGTTGLQLAADARRLRPELKVLLTTGDAADTIGRALPEEVTLLDKPYDRTQLVSLIRVVLAS